jgi:isopenicillin N synthase-like dioxygenase
MRNDLPVIDVSSFALDVPRGSAAADAAAAAIDLACRETGFVLIAGHGIAPSTRAAMFEQIERFFALPVAEKEKIAIGKSDSHRGYVALATESLDDANTMAGDLKETIDTGLDHGPEHPAVLAGTPLHGLNQLPDLPGFREVYEQYRAEAIAAAERVQRAMARALGIDDNYFNELGDTMYHLRFVHYPPQDRLRPTDGQLGCGAHTDYGTITLLADDGVGGLQVMRRDGEWLEVDVPEDLYVCNLGDLLAIWTNDRWVSNPHRVINPPWRDRYSIPLFVTPPFHARIECLPTCLEPHESPKYQPLEAGPYLLSRFDSTHSYRNELLEEFNRTTTSSYR